MNSGGMCRIGLLKDCLKIRYAAGVEVCVHGGLPVRCCSSQWMILQEHAPGVVLHALTSYRRANQHE